MQMIYVLRIKNSCEKRSNVHRIVDRLFERIRIQKHWPNIEGIVLNHLCSRINQFNISTMKTIYTALLAIVCSIFALNVSAQPWSYDFGTGTGVANNANSGSGNTAFFTSTPSGGGTYRVRIGTGGGNVTLANPGTSLGLGGSEAQLNATTGASTNKFTVFGWTSPTTASYASFKMRNTSSGNGVLSFHLGGGATVPFNDATGYTSYNNSLACFRINYATAAITSVERRISGSWVAVTGSGIAKDTDQLIEVIGNNASTSTSYEKSGTNSLNAQSWDLWVDGTKISPSGGWAKAGTLVADLTLGGLGFWGEASTANAAFIYLDDLEYSNALPLCTAPTTQATSITFPAITTSDMNISWTSGSGGGRVVKMNTSNSFTAPANGSNPTANLTWANAGEQVVYNGTGSGPITIDGLTQSTLYYFRVYEYCDAGRVYNTNTDTGNPNSQSTAAGPGLSSGTLTAFGAQCTGSDYGPNMFTISGANLTVANVTVTTAIPQYTFSTTGIPGSYTASLSLTQGGGSFTQDVYVLFSPAAVTTYNGNIVVGGGGATNINVAVSGSGISSGAPTVNTPTSADILATTATLGASIASLNCSDVSERGIEWSLSNGFANGAGTAVSETGTFGTGAFTEAVTGLPSNTTIYWKAYAINGNGSTYTAQQTFVTGQEFLSVGDISILAFNASTPDNFAFVNWVSIPQNMVIKFTDGGFNGTAPNSATTALNARGTENFVIWKNTTAGPIAAGTVIKIEALSATLGTVTAGTAVTGLGGLSGSGDQIFAYQGNALTGATPDYASAAATTTFTGNILFGINAHGSSPATTWLSSGSGNSNDSYLPTELNVANGNIALTGNAVGGQYTGTRSALGSILAYRNLVNNQANWTKVTGSGLVTVDVTAFSVNPNVATQVAVTAINGGINPSANTPFAVSIETRDASNNAAAVAIDTDFQISFLSGTGSFLGTLTGTILAGNGTLDITGVIYNTAETGVSLTVSAIAGMSLTSGASSTFTVDDAADHLAFVNLESYVYTSNNIPTFTVEARRPDNSVDVNYIGSATISLSSGTGTVLGTLTKPVTAGIASFNDISFDEAGTKQLDVVVGVLPTETSSNITVSSASLTEVFLPEFMEGKQPTNTNRIPYAYRVTLDGLKPNSTFRYYNSVVVGSDAANSNGAGNAIFADPAGFVRSGGTSLATAGNYGEFTTNGAGSYTGWFITEPTGNATRFNPGTDVYCRIILNNGNDGTIPTVRLTTASSVRVIEVGALAAQGTALRGNSGAPARNFVLLYNNVAGTGRPIAGSFIESDGSLNDNGTNSYSTFYSANVDGVEGAYGVIIPNTLANGIRRIEQRQLSDGALAGCASTDADGSWPGGASTVNPNGGILTPRVILSTDAPLIASPEVCDNLIDDNCDGNIDELCPGNFPNDTPAGAPVISYSTNMNYPNCYPITGNNTAANNSGESVAFDGPDSWYRFVAQSTAASITMTSSTMDDAIALYSKSGISYTLIASENASSGLNDFERLNVSGLTPGTTYYISASEATGAAGGSFTLCIQNLMPSGCAYTQPVGGFGLCSNYKAIFRGSTAAGVTYNFTFTGVGGGASGTTSVNGTNGLVPLSNPTLALRYGGIYNVAVDVVYSLLDSAGDTEVITVNGSVASANCSGVTIMAQPQIEVKLSQRCNAVLLRSNYLIGTPVAGNTNACGAINYSYEFTSIDGCGLATNGLPVYFTTNGATPYLQLGNLPILPNQGAWRVAIAPVFSYGIGTYGPPQDILVNQTAAIGMLSDDQLSDNADKMFNITPGATIYPNPNSGDLLNLNLTDVTSDAVYVRIMDNVGRVIYSDRFTVDGSLNTIVSFDQPLTSGMYFVEFRMNDTIVTERMVVQK
jgi:hypothetical protein